MKLKYDKYKQKYINLKKQYGGSSHFMIMDKDLVYYHKKYRLYNNYITIYGYIPNHDYTTFLHKYIDSLYSTKREQIIMLYKNTPEQELMKIDTTEFKFYMDKDEQMPQSVIKKAVAIVNGSLEHFFTFISKYSYTLPNTSIIYDDDIGGDIKVIQMYETLLKQISYSTTKTISKIQYEKLNQFNKNLTEQLKKLTESHYQDAITQIQLLFSRIESTMIISKAINIINNIIYNWSGILYLQMILPSIDYAIQKKDFTLFIPESYVPYLIMGMHSPGIITNGDDITYIKSKSSSYVIDDDLDDLDDTEFLGRSRFKYNEIDPTKYYDIRFKRDDQLSYYNYKLKSCEGRMFILEQNPKERIQLFTNPIIKLDVDNIYLYENID